MRTAQDQQTEYSEAKIVCVIGGPGVGKGTQCTRLATDLNLVHISVGDLLRKDARRPDADVQIDAVMRNASLVPYSYVRDVLDACLAEHVQQGRTKFLIDGFPRSEEQAEFFDRGTWAPTSILHFHCSEDVMLARMMRRAKTSGRVDDTTEIFQRRYARHMDDVSSIVDALSRIGKGNDVVHIDCEGDLDEIYEGLRDQVKVLYTLLLSDESLGRAGLMMTLRGFLNWVQTKMKPR